MNNKDIIETSMEEEKLFMPLTSTQRIPISAQASAMVSGVKYISPTAVTPDVKYSKIANLVSV